jgi:hypothetical protein
MLLSIGTGENETSNSLTAPQQRQHYPLCSCQADLHLLYSLAFLCLIAVDNTKGSSKTIESRSAAGRSAASIR